MSRLELLKPLHLYSHFMDNNKQGTDYIYCYIYDCTYALTICLVGPYHLLYNKDKTPTPCKPDPLRLEAKSEEIKEEDTMMDTTGK